MRCQGSNKDGYATDTSEFTLYMERSPPMPYCRCNNIISTIIF